MRLFISIDIQNTLAMLHTDIGDFFSELNYMSEFLTHRKWLEASTARKIEENYRNAIDGKLEDLISKIRYTGPRLEQIIKEELLRKIHQLG